MRLFLLELGQLSTEFTWVFMVELVMLCLLMVVGLYVAYTDLRFRDIPPAAIWTLLGVGLSGQLALWSLGKTNLSQVGLLVVVGFAVSYLLYVYGFWAPGDAKLFWAIAVAFPPTLSFSPSLLSLNAPLWSLLINAVLINFTFLLVWLFLHRDRTREKRLPLPGAVAWFGLGRDTAAVCGLVAGGSLLLLGKSLDFGTAAIIAVVGGLVWQRLVPAPHRAIPSIPGLGLAVYAALAPDSWSLMLALWGTSWLILAIQALIRARFGDALVQPLPVEALQAGMVPALGICTASGGDHVGTSYVCSEHISTRRHALCRPGVALTDKDLVRLRSLAATGCFASFGARLPVETPVRIPIDVERRFRCMSTTDSGGCRAGIPAMSTTDSGSLGHRSGDVEQPFRSSRPPLLTAAGQGSVHDAG